MQKKVFFQKLGIFAVSVISLGLLVWAMFIPESNVFWNTYLGALIAGFIYFLVKFWRDRWDKNEYGSVLGKISVVGMCTSIFGPTAQMLGLHFAGTNIMANANISSLPCQFGISWALLLLAFCLMATYGDTKNEKPVVRWFVMSCIVWLLSMQVAFLDEVLKVFGYTLPEWLENIFSVVYPVIFFGAAILAFCCLIRGIFGKD